MDAQWVCAENFLRCAERSRVEVEDRVRRLVERAEPREKEIGRSDPRRQ